MYRVVQFGYPGGFGVQRWSWWPLGWRYFTDSMDLRGVKRFWSRKDADDFINRLQDAKEDLRVGF